MRKTGLNTFIYSFALSLFVIFSANGFVVRGKKSEEKKIFNSGKNISLFFKNAPESVGAPTVPIKKIALSIPKEETPVMTSQNIDQIPLEAGNAIEEIKIASIEEMFVNQEKFDDFEKTANIHNVIENKSEHKDREMVLALLDKREEQKKLKEAESDKEKASFIPLERKENNNYRRNLIRNANDADKTQVAMSNNDASLKDMAREGMDFSDSEFENIPEKQEWETMQEINPDAQNPWVVAKGAKHPTNQMMLEQSFSKDAEENKPLLIAKDVRSSEEVLASAEIVKNILIPIPEDIMSQDELTPQLVVSEDDDEGVEKAGDIEDIKEKVDLDNKKGLFDSIKSKLSSMGSKVSTGSSRNEDIMNDLSQNQKDSGGEKRSNKILPTEMKLSFQPNRAEISGQTLKWVHAFANKAKEEGVMLEIRINGSGSQELQNRRLNLLHTIIDKQGLDKSKINTVFTAREANSFVIRAVKISEDRSRLLERKAKEREMLPYYHHTGTRTPQNFQQW